MALAQGLLTFFGLVACFLGLLIVSCTIDHALENLINPSNEED